MAYLVSFVSLLLPMTCQTVFCQTFPTYSEELLNFVSVMNGQYTNARQVAVQAQNCTPRCHGHVYNVRTVDIPALSGLVTLYLDESYDELLVFKAIAIVSEGWDGEFFISVHNLTDYYKFSAETIDYSNFENDDITEQPMCEAVYEKLEKSANAYFENYKCYNPDTDDYYGYDSTYTCTGLLSIPEGNSMEKHELVPYNLKKTKRYPLPDYLLEGYDNFVVPCADS